MIKIDVFDMERFLETVNGCAGRVNLVHGNGKKENIAGRYGIQAHLMQAYKENGGHMRLMLQIPTPSDYFKIVGFATGNG